ncbi:MAG: Asp-tRNA(Asn)/Glu-tRNA(Gln) amidotransferase subunit GatB [Patescibacteria group bacterium]|nr:Asp-tRNA(Asn)/Glu-tRNA(Gln) amidotransferase subunit GatB [Patescibacteria group bacterium]
MEYKPTIGLEVHVELKTRTKMFCDSLNDADEKKPNKNTCPVCLGHPGTLPVPNKEAIKHVIRVGLALGGKINPVTKFDRKNYFYPDLPKGYQISQYDQPLVTGGNLLGIKIRRIHLEEDTGTLVHAQGSSLVDFNRAGMPLMELVTEPDITSAEEAADFGRELQLILRYLGVSDADMEKGHMRLEANVSLNMGTKVEIKNINSFKAARDATLYELERQEELLRDGKDVAHETRGWDEAKQITVSQRSKEEAHDYRYFPEPDIPPFETVAFEPDILARELPELPAAKRTRFIQEYKIDEGQSAVLISSPKLAEYFEESVSELKEMERDASASLLANYLINDVRAVAVENGVSLEQSHVNPEHLAHLVVLIIREKITSRQAKDMLEKIFQSDVDPEDILKDESYYAISDSGELDVIVQDVFAENSQAVADYKKGKIQSLQFLVGKAMGKLKGKGNPEVLRELFMEYLKKK